MALTEGQWQIGDLVIGPDDTYGHVQAPNPYRLDVRADQSGDRPWAHGTWSGAEWADERVVSARITLLDEAAADRREAMHDLAAAFAPVATSGDVELRWREGGEEFVLFGRPRGARARRAIVETGVAEIECGFVAQDPRIRSGSESTASTGLPTQTGGLTAPVTAPLTVDGTLSGGSASLVNDGTAAAELSLRIDGPVTSPTIVLQGPGGDLSEIRVDLTLTSSQWLEIDTAARTALLNGLPQANQRGRTVWDVDPRPLEPGTTTLRYLAGDFNATTEVTATWRSAWW